MSPRGELRQFWLSVAVATALAAGLAAVGWFFADADGQQREQQIARRVLLAAATVESQAVELQLRASLASARTRLNEDHGSIASAGGYGIRAYARAGDEFVANEPGPPETSRFPAAPIADSVDRNAFLWPEAAPRELVYCSAAAPERLMCASLPLAAALEIAAGRSMLALELSSSAPLVLARSSAWAMADQSYVASEVLKPSAPFTGLRVVGRFAYQLFPGRYIGVYFAAATVLGYLLLLAWLVSRHNMAQRHLALEDAIARTQASGDNLVRGTLRTAALSTGQLMWLLREDERIELIGPWQEQVGLAEGVTSLGQALADVDDKANVRAGMAAAMKARAPFARILVIRVDGEPLTHQVNSAPLNAADGRFVGLLGVSIDITAALATQAQSMRDEAFRGAQTGYLRHMAREVSGPAMHVQAVVELLARQIGPTEDFELKRLLRLASAEAHRLGEVVRGSLELMNLRGTNTYEVLRPTDASAVVSAVANSISGLDSMSQRQISVIDGGAKVRSVMAHEPSLASMLRIVLDNALKYSPRGAAVDICFVETADALLVEIEDSGPGMAPKELLQIAEPFFRGSSSIGVPGSGLGIATCFELARHTNSSIAFHRSEKPGRGLLVSIRLPWAH